MPFYDGPTALGHLPPSPAQPRRACQAEVTAAGGAASTITRVPAALEARPAPRPRAEASRAVCHRRRLAAARCDPLGALMRDPRTRQLAHLIVNHSCELRSGEAVLIEAFDLADGLVLDLIEESRAVGAIPIVSL